MSESTDSGSASTGVAKRQRSPWLRFSLSRLFVVQLAVAVVIVAVRTEHVPGIWCACLFLVLALDPVGWPDELRGIQLLVACWASIGLTYALYSLTDGVWPDYEPAAIGLSNAAVTWLIFLSAKRDSGWLVLLMPLWLITAAVMGWGIFIYLLFLNFTPPG